MFSVLFSAIEAGPAKGTRVRVCGLVGVGGVYEDCRCGILVKCSMSVSSRPVDIAYLTVARTASMFGAHVVGQMVLSLLNRRRSCLFLCLSEAACMRLSDYSSWKGELSRNAALDAFIVEPHDHLFILYMLLPSGCTGYVGQ